MLRNLFHMTFQILKVIDERMTVNKDIDSRSWFDSHGSVRDCLSNSFRFNNVVIGQQLRITKRGSAWLALKFREIIADLME